MDKRKILFLIPSLVGGGAERTLINLLNRIDYSKYEVDLVSVVAKGVYLDQVPKQVKLITLFNNDYLVRALSKIQKKTGFDLVFRYVMKAKVKGRYDVAISYLDSNFTDFLFFTEKIGKRYSWVHTSYRSYQNFYKFYKNSAYRDKLIKKRYGKLDGIFFVSDDSRKEFVEIFGNFPVMDVVYNIIDREMVTLKANEKISFDDSKFSFVSVGSLLPVKGYDRLIRAAKILKGKGYSFKIDLLGKGPEEATLKGMVRERGLEHEVIFHGFSSNPYPYMRAANAFVMTSVSEALPTVLCEAMILGKPVVVTNCSGCRELVDNGQYGLMAEQDDDDLAAKMEIFLKEQHLLEDYCDRALRRSALFDSEKVMEKYYQILNS